MFRLKLSRGANISPYWPASRWSAWVIGNLSLNRSFIQDLTPKPLPKGEGTKIHIARNTHDYTR